MGSCGVAEGFEMGWRGSDCEGWETWWCFWLRANKFGAVVLVWENRGIG